MKTRKNKIFVAAIIALAMMLNLTSVFATISAGYSTPSVTPPSGVHPRVLFTASDIQNIKAVIAGSDDENDSARTWFRRRVDNRAEDLNKEGSNDNAGGDVSDSDQGWNVSKLSNIEAKALAYVLGETVHYSVWASNTELYPEGYRETTPEVAGALAIDYLLTYLDTCDLTKISSASDRTRPAAQIMLVAAEVYDWCYPLLTSSQKTTIINKVETKLANKTEMGWPPINQGSVVGHGAESQLLQGMLAFAIATYDERPDIWNVVAGRFYEEFVPVRNRYLKSGYNLQGSEYGNFRSMWDLWSYLLITGMGASSPYDSDATAGLKKLAYQQLYSTRPDGQNFRDGDDPDDDKYDELFDSYVRYINPMVDSAINNDPYLKTHYIEYQGQYYNSALLQIVVSGKYNTTSVQAKSFKNLPNTYYFSEPANVLFTRTGWNIGPTSADVAATIKFPTDFVGNHQHYDAGSFQLYYKGILASDSGIYQGANTSNSSGGSGYESPHRKNYAVQTVAHNSVLIDGKNQINYYNITNEPDSLSGVKKNTVASVDSYEVDRNNPNRPNFTYIKGDLKNAYSSISGYKRSFMFLDLKRDDVPAALIVYDYINASGKNKRWLLHGQQQPTTSNGQTVFVNTASDESGSYNGKMTVTTLLPQDPSISIVGGSGNYSKAANGTNYETAETGKACEEGNTYRMEISSTGSQFLNVMQVSDADQNNYLPVSRIGGSYVAGAVIADRVVTFNNEGAIFTGAFNFEAPKGTYEYTVCDVKRGAWKVSTDSTFATYDVVGTTNADNGNVLQFTKTLSSKQTLYFELVNGSGGFSGSGFSPVERSLGTPTLYNFATIYTKALGEDERTEFTTRNDAIFDDGMPLVAADDIAEILDANLSISGNTATFTKDGKSCSFTVGSATMNKAGEVVDKSEEATPAWINGTFYISPVSIATYYYAALQVNAEDLEITFTPDAADGDMYLEYSIDGVNYTAIDDFDEETTDYEIELPYQVTMPTLRVVNSLGAQYFSVSNSAEDEPGQPGYGDWSNATDASKEQYSLDRFLSNGNTMTEAKVPIKNDYGTARMYYTAPGASSQVEYTVKFHSRQPKLTYLSTNMPDSSSTAVFYYPVYVRGGAVANDNGTILDTRISNGNTRTWALANVSPSLQGASMFILPITTLISTSRNTGDSPSRTTMFDFAADCPGRVVVLMANAAGEASEYVTNSAWHAGTNNGVGINGIKSGSNVVTKETMAPSADAQYHAMAYKWISAAYTAEDKDDNLLRTYYPGVVTAPSAAIKDSQKLLYGYYRDFDEGETVTIPNPKNLVKSDEKNDIMGVFVIYETDPTPPPAEDIQITYKSGNGGYRTLSGVKDNKTEYSVTLPDYSKYAYVNLAVPEGQEAPTAVTYSNEFHGVEGSSLVGTDGALATNSNQQAQCWIPARTDSSGNYIVPIKNENAELHFTYEDEEGTARDYTVTFTAKQERLTEFTDNTTNSYGKVVFIGGAAANNDNGTITETSARGNPSTIRAIGNISKHLVGSSIFMLPAQNGSDYAVGNTVFSFRADHDGNVIVMSDTVFNSNSVYEKGEEGWSRVNNRNWGKNYVSLSNKALKQSRAYNDYSGVDYLAISTKWHIQSYTAEATGYNLYRLENPGVDGDTTVDNSAANASTAGSWFMSSAYKKHFKAGDLVEIKGWGHGSQDTAVFVEWCDAEDPQNVIDIKYSVDNENFASLPNVSDGKLDYKVIMPDNSKYAYVKFDVPEGVDEPEMLYTTWSIRNTDYETGDALVGTDGAMGGNSIIQSQVPMDALTENGAYVVPIKSEKGVLSFQYKNRPYTITFVAKQPRITLLTDETTNENAGVIFVGGAAANNNNGTITESSGRGSGVVNIRAIGNISESLIGASIFMLPEMDGTDNDFFTFTADHGGTIVVMSDTAITNSAYSSWTQRNSGTVATNVGLGGGDNASGRLTKARTFNNYGNKESTPSNNGVFYYAVSTKWWCHAYSSDRWGYNAYRSFYPGLYDAANQYGSKPDDCDSAKQSTAGNWGMVYCYSKTFEAGDEVTVPGWGAGNDSQDSAIFVIWDDAEVSGVPYVVEDDSIIAGADTYAGGQVITAVYAEEDGAMLDLVFGRGSIPFGEIDEDDTRIIGMFVTDLDTLEPIFTKKEDIKIFR